MATVQNTEEDSRTRIILDLSSKISEQDNHIRQLELTLHEREQVIVELRGGKNAPSAANRSVTLQPVTPAAEFGHFVGTETPSAWGDSEGETATLEMKQIQEEMGKLKSGRQREKNAPLWDFQKSSAKSQDSGVVEPLEEPNRDCLKTRSGQGCHPEERRSCGLHQGGLDPSSIRQISAGKNRSSPRSPHLASQAARTLTTLCKGQYKECGLQPGEKYE